jgi:hypothetical protein
MKNALAGSFFLIAMSAGAPSVVALDAQACLECHEPAEDWTGMTADEVYAAATSPDNKRHKENTSVGEAELKAIIAALMPQ